MFNSYATNYQRVSSISGPLHFQHFLTFLVFLAAVCVSHCDPRTLKPHRTARLPVEIGCFDSPTPRREIGTVKKVMEELLRLRFPMVLKPTSLVVVDVGDSIRSNI